LEAKRQLSSLTKMVGFPDIGKPQIETNDGTAPHLVDCGTAEYDFPPTHGISVGRISMEQSPPRILTPVLFSPWNKISSSDMLLLCFWAIRIEQTTGLLPKFGILIHGNDYRQKTVKIENHLPRAREIIGAIGSTLVAQQPPSLVLNRHCGVCDYQEKCRGLAIERDDLSLLTAMTPKHRAKSYAKGISTISQLSYGYRPRRRKRTVPNLERAAKSITRGPPPAKNDQKLKALAIKKCQIHVVGVPSLIIEGTPTFVDVEGMPDRDFYYLIGVRFEVNGKTVEQSLWADEPDGEQEIWQKFLQTLKAIGNAQIVSYGAYEARFLRQMKQRYPLPPEDASFVHRLIESSVNLLGSIYGKVYFPTFSNGLKEVGRYLGFEWAWPNASGAAAPLLRRAWELGACDDLRGELLSYNLDDCRAAAMVADALLRIGSGSASGFNEVGVGSLEIGFQRSFGKFDSAIPEFTKINQAAYWDYQRSKVYVRTDRTVRRTIRISQDTRKSESIQQELIDQKVPASCARCESKRFWAGPRRSHVVYDLKFTGKGIKRWAVRYHYRVHRCSECRAEVLTYSRGLQYGQNLLAFVTYLMVELRLSNQLAANHTAALFGYPLKKYEAYNIKSRMAEKYKPTYHGLLRQISKGTLVHADETKGVVKGGGHYVWVFTNLTTVAYVYAESREAAILERVLEGFSGVLVSDFYAAYDSVPCPQQKCLIHLMRDINEDLHRNPFDEELKEIARRFGTLLREIVETIDTHGLKARHLGKHKRSAEGFIEDVVAMKCATEAGMALRKRIEKNRAKLFTFLEYDGIPWNNNNAEHAVKAFTKLRNVIGTSTPKGTEEYATLLSIQQTLKYRGMDFLKFMRSGKMEIDI
jgi:predicted RecB family nuclease